MRLTYNKKQYIFVNIAIIMAILFQLATYSSSYAYAEELSPDESVRIHIKANSNDADDISIKNECLNVLLAEIESLNVSVANKDEFLLAVDQNKSNIINAINEYLEQNGVSYVATIAIEKASFPIRMYGERVIEEGEFDSITILLGAGEGDNWWCIAFPDLCFTKKAKSSGKKIVFKSRLADLFKKWF